MGKCTTGYLGHKWYNVPGGTGGTLNPASPRGTVYPGGARVWHKVTGDTGDAGTWRGTEGRLLYLGDSVSFA